MPAVGFPVGYKAATLAVQKNYHPCVEEQSIIPKTTLITGYAEGSYELTDEVEAFGEFLFNRRKTYQNGWRQFWNFGFTGDIYNTGNAIGAGTIWAPGWVGYNFVSPTGVTNHADNRSEEHTSELQSLMRISYAVFCLQKKNKTNTQKLNDPK